MNVQVMKKHLLHTNYFSLKVGLFLFLLLGLINAGKGQTTLATYYFENNTTPQAGAIGSPSLVTNSTSYVTSSVCQGTYSIESNADGDYVELTIATTGYENILVQWEGRYSGGNFGSATWSLTGDYGSGYGSALTSQSLNTTCTLFSYNLSPDFNNKSSIKLRITFSNSWDRNGRLDELSIIGTELCAPEGDPAVFGSSEWNVYAFNGSSIDLSGVTYRGYYTEPNLTFDTRSRWDGTATPSSASGYQGCAVNIDNHTFIHKRRGFTCGTYQIDVAGHDDNARLYVNGNQVWEHIGCCDTHPNVWTGILDANSTVEFRVAEGTGDSYGALTFSGTPTPAAVDEPADQMLCAESSTDAIVFTGTGTYNWTNDNTSIGLTTSGIGNIPSFTASNGGASPIVATLTVIPTNGGCTGNPQTFTITVNPLPTASATKTDISCFNAHNGQIVVTGSSGREPYTYSIYNGLLNEGVTYHPENTFGNLDPGEYKIRVKDSNGCESTQIP
jgi:hypothetical protein